MVDGVDYNMIEGVLDMIYFFFLMNMDQVFQEILVLVLWWWFVGYIYMVYVMEIVIDWIVKEIGKDLVVLCFDLLKDDLCKINVLKLVVEKVGWDMFLLEGCYCGVVVYKFFGFYVVEVVEILFCDDGMVKVEKVIVVVDCGILVNLDNICV